MKNIIYALMFFCIVKSYAQDNKEVKYNVSLEIQHSMRIPFHDVKIDIEGLFSDKNNVRVKVKSIPKSSEKKWNYSRVDTVYTITDEQFYKISEKIKKININDFVKTLHYMHKDGMSTKLTLSGLGNNIVYNLRSPSKKGERGYVEYYRETCELILKRAGFNKEDIDIIL